MDDGSSDQYTSILPNYPMFNSAETQLMPQYPIGQTELQRAIDPKNQFVYNAFMVPEATRASSHENKFAIEQQYQPAYYYTDCNHLGRRNVDSVDGRMRYRDVYVPPNRVPTMSSIHNNGLNRNVTPTGYPHMQSLSAQPFNQGAMSPYSTNELVMQRREFNPNGEAAPVGFEPISPIYNRTLPQNYAFDGRMNDANATNYRVYGNGGDENFQIHHQGYAPKCERPSLFGEDFIGDITSDINIWFVLFFVVLLLIIQKITVYFTNVKDESVHRTT
jgi:hypothetical protein